MSHESILVNAALIEEQTMLDGTLLDLPAILTTEKRNESPSSKMVNLKLSIPLNPQNYPSVYQHFVYLALISQDRY